MLLHGASVRMSAPAQELDRWEERLEELFAGRPYDIYDAALTATISDFPVSIQPFRDMVSCALWKRCREACRKACLAPVHPTSVDCCLSTGQPAASACSKDITSVCRRSEVLMMCCSD